MRGALSSWRDGPAKQAILEFVAAASGLDGSEPVPVEERVAVFDNDGRLWCEQPVPIQMDFICAASSRWPRRTRLCAAASGGGRPTRKTTPGAAVMMEHYAGDDRNVKTLAGGALVAYAGVSVEEFEARADRFLRAAQHPTLGRGYLGCAYAPMVELLALLTVNAFADYVVSGGGRDFMRPISQELYGIPRERVIGSATALAYTSDERGGTIIHTPAPDYLDDGPEMPIPSGVAPAAGRCSRQATRTATSRYSTSPGTTTSRSCACSCSTTTPSASSTTPPARRASTRTSRPGRLDDRQRPRRLGHRLLTRRPAAPNHTRDRFAL